MPSPGVPHFAEKVATSLVGEFNRTQRESGKMECSNGSTWNWLKQGQPKHAIYPHKFDDYDFCAAKNETLSRQRTTLNRIRQSGSASMEEQQAIESTISDLQEDLKEHKLEAARSSENYHELTK